MKNVWKVKPIGGKKEVEKDVWTKVKKGEWKYKHFKIVMKKIPDTYDQRSKVIRKKIDDDYYYNVDVYKDGLTMEGSDDLTEEEALSAVDAYKEEYERLYKEESEDY